MSESDQFWEYAQEALQWASQSKIEKEKRTLLELARTWSQAALESDSLSNALDECAMSPVRTNDAAHRVRHAIWNLVGGFRHYKIGGFGAG